MCLAELSCVMSGWAGLSFFWLVKIFTELDSLGWVGLGWVWLGLACLVWVGLQYLVEKYY